MAKNEKNIHFPDDPEELNKDRYSVDADKKVPGTNPAFPKDPVDLGVDDPERQVDDQTVSFPSLTNEDVNKKMEEDEELAQEPLPEVSASEASTDEIEQMSDEQQSDHQDADKQFGNADTDNESDNKGKGKTKKKISAQFLWGISLVCAIIFGIVFAFLPFIPTSWKIVCVIFLVVLMCITRYFSFRKVKNKVGKDGKKKQKKVVIKVINIILSCLLALLSFALPHYKGEVDDMLETNNFVKDKRIKMNLYVMSDEYKAEHPELFGEKKRLSTEFKDESDELKAYADDTFLTLITLDTNCQKLAIDKLTDIYGKEVALKDNTSVKDAVDALYSNECSVLLSKSDFVTMLPDEEKYEDFNNDTRIMYTIYLPEQTSTDIKLSDTDLTEKPFAVFIGGNDEEGTLTLTGRTDVDMVVVVNPKTYQLGLFSFPRDSMVPNPAAGNALDKLTHLGMSGLDNTLEGLSKVLDFDIDNYVLLNFTTYREAIAAIGGVDIDNPYEFGWSFSDTVFPEGHIHLDEWSSLAYVRERKSLPDGDFGRVMHQQIVMKAILNKITSPEMLVHFDSLLKGLSGTFLTNLTSDSIYNFMQYQLANNISWNIVNYKLDGGTGMAVTASAPGQNLSVVFPYKNQILFMQKEIDKIEAGETVTQEEMPEGYGYMWHGTTLPDAPSETEEIEESTTSKATAKPETTNKPETTESIGKETQTAEPEKTAEPSNQETSTETADPAQSNEAAAETVQ